MSSTQGMNCCNAVATPGPIFLPLRPSSDVPLELLQARNAMRIARWRGADKYAPESWAEAQAALNRAEDYQTRKQRNSVPTASREAIQGFEDAITVSAQRQADERLAQEREALGSARGAGHLRFPGAYLLGGLSSDLFYLSSDD